MSRAERAQGFAPAESFEVQGVAVFDTATLDFVPNQTVEIRNGRISSIRAAVTDHLHSRSMASIDGRGRYLIPGLIDAHAHLAHFAEKTFVTGDEYLPLFLAAGVTSVRSTGDPIVAAAGVKRFSEARPDRSPRIHLASPLIDGDPPVHLTGLRLTDPERIDQFVDEMCRWEVSTLKIYYRTRREVGARLISAAHERGIKVTGHLGHYSAQDAANDGIDCLEHIESVVDFSTPDGLLPQFDYRIGLRHLDLNNPRCTALIELLHEKQVTVVPTLVTFDQMLYLHDRPGNSSRPELQYMPASFRDYWESWKSESYENQLDPSTLDDRMAVLEKYRELTLLLHRRGINLLVGADAANPFVVPGFSLHDELAQFVDAGLTEAEALRAATLGGAEFLGVDDELGTIEQGKLADMVLLTENPLDDIRHTRSIELVFRGGLICHPADLLSLVPA